MSEWRGSMESAELRGVEARLSLMDAESIAMQVNYPTMLLGWPVAPDPDLNRAISRACNNRIADISSQSGGRLQWVAVIDFNDPAEAAHEIERAKAFGALGIMVPGWVGDRSIAADTYDPIWAAAAETDLSVAVHSMIASISFDDQQFHFSVLSGFYHVVG